VTALLVALHGSNTGKIIYIVCERRSKVVPFNRDDSQLFQTCWLDGIWSEHHVYPNRWKCGYRA